MNKKRIEGHRTVSIVTPVWLYEAARAYTLGYGGTYTDFLRRSLMDQWSHMKANRALVDSEPEDLLPEPIIELAKDHLTFLEMTKNTGMTFPQVLWQRYLEMRNHYGVTPKVLIRRVLGKELSRVPQKVLLELYQNHLRKEVPSVT